MSEVLANCARSIIYCNATTASLNNEIPKNMNPNARMIFPIPFRVCHRRNLFISHPIAAIPSANAPILKLNPTYTTRTHSIVDHTLAPIIAHMALGNVNNHAPAKARIISDVTLLDCNNVVTQNALNIASRGVLVSLLSHLLSAAHERS